MSRDTAITIKGVLCNALNIDNYPLVAHHALQRHEWPWACCVKYDQKGARYWVCPFEGALLFSFLYFFASLL